VIRNMSETGAQLIVESPIGIPDDFTLLIKPELIKRACRVAWRKADRIGVRFIYTSFISWRISPLGQ